MSRKIFISHKNTDESNAVGENILKSLEDKNYDVFFDKDFLQGGSNWKRSIWDNLIASDVLLLVLDEETATSDWVQREVDIALALRISILPVVIGYSIEKVQKSLKRFDLLDIQAIKYEGLTQKRIVESIQKILELIEPLSKSTEEKQIPYYNQGLKRHHKQEEEIVRTVAGLNPKRVTYKLPGYEKLSFYIATGDASEMKDYEVLVNTENDYMQMARFYQTRTLSYQVRKRGAHMEAEDLLHDTIQLQLFDAVNKFPVTPGTVLATNAGHEKSDFRKYTNYRYILHAAAVRFDPDATPPNQPVGRISNIIENCVRKISQIDKAQGKLETQKEVIVSESDNYEPIKSVLFPFFGAGEGGAELEKVAGKIINSFAKRVPQLIEREELSVNEIGLSIFHEEDVEMIKSIFLGKGFQEII